MTSLSSAMRPLSHACIAFLFASLATMLVPRVHAATLVAWGDDTYQQLDPPLPDSTYTHIGAGWYHSFGIRPEGSVDTWGWSHFGQCEFRPSDPSPIVAVAGGWAHSLALRANGAIEAWGLDNYGQCQVPLPDSGYVAIAAGEEHSLALRRDSTIAAWGRDDYGQSDPPPGHDYVAIAAGTLHSLALRADGSIACWGYDSYGQCDVPSPDSGFIAIAAGWAHSLALRADGSLVRWGYEPDAMPVPNTGFVAIAACGDHDYALRTNGSIAAWGLSNHGENDVPEPNTGFTSVAAGFFHGMALRSSTADVSPGGAAAAHVVLEPCAPNPFTASTSITCILPAAGAARLAVYDVRGTRVRRLVDGPLGAGRHVYRWDGRDDAGRPVPAGVYLYRIDTGGATRTRRVARVR